MISGYADHTVAIGVEIHRNKIVVDVADTGEPMAPETLAQKIGPGP